MTRLVSVVAAALVAPDNRILVAQRPEGGSLAGLWEFPGGKIELGETPEAALVRELNEELGVTVAPDALLPATFASAELAGSHLVMLVYLVRTWAGTPVPLHASDLRWCTLVELAALAMPPADAPLIPLLARLL
jgi:8-oxo-dGTP diphosphatase